MKLAKIFIVMSVIFSASASKIVVSGNLMDDIKMDGPIQKLIFTANKTEVSLVNSFNEVESCEEGEFELTELSSGKYRLSKVLKCESWVDETKDVEYCPEVFLPVCGELKNEANSKALPELVEFSNMCELYISKATFIRMGSCQ